MVREATNTAVFIVDLARTCGTMSVTNDAESVVKIVASEYGNRRIFYRDTCGRWDELVHDNGRFLRFAPGDQ